MTQLISGKSRDRVTTALADGYAEVLRREFEDAGAVEQLPAIAAELGGRVLMTMEGYLRAAGLNEPLDDWGFWSAWDKLVLARRWAPPSEDERSHWLLNVELGLQARGIEANQQAGIITALTAAEVTGLVAAAVAAAVGGRTGVTVERDADGNVTGVVPKRPAPAIPTA